MKCPECYGERFRRGRFEYSSVIEGRPVLFRNVAGRQCTQCGYLVISGRTLEAIDRVLAHGQADSLAMIEVFDMANQKQVAHNGATVPDTVTTLPSTPRLRPLVDESRLIA